MQEKIHCSSQSTKTFERKICGSNKKRKAGECSPPPPGPSNAPRKKAKVARSRTTELVDNKGSSLWPTKEVIDDVFGRQVILSWIMYELDGQY